MSRGTVLENVAIWDEEVAKSGALRDQLGGKARPSSRRPAVESEGSAAFERQTPRALPAAADPAQRGHAPSTARRDEDEAGRDGGEELGAEGDGDRHAVLPW